MKALLAAAAVIVVTAAGCGAEDAHLLPPGRALAVSRTLAPSPHLFGDTVSARLELVVDRRLLDPERLRVSADFRPYERVGAVRRARRDYGPYTRLLYQYELHCLTSQCIPTLVASSVAGSQVAAGEERRTFRLPPARILSKDPGQESASLLRPVFWPAVVAVSRVKEAQAGARYPVRASPTELPALSTWISPPLFAGVLLAVVFGLLVWPARFGLTWWRARQPEPIVVTQVDLTPVEQALELVEWACRQPDGRARREALERLADALDEFGTNGIVARTRALAWSRSSPSPGATAELVVDVRGDDGHLR